VRNSLRARDILEWEQGCEPFKLIATIPLPKWYSFQEKLLELPVYYAVKLGTRGKLGTRATFLEKDTSSEGIL